MKQPHKHAELIKAWADGADIQVRVTKPHITDRWMDCDHPAFVPDLEYRIKPEPKPDVVRWVYGRKNMGYDTFENACDEVSDVKPNLKLTFDGETGKLKSAEVL